MRISGLLRMIAILMFCCTFLISCTGNNSVLLPFLEASAENDAPDFGGYDFVMLDAPNPASPNYPSSVTGDAILARYNEVEDRFNVDLVINYGDGEDFPYYLSMDIAAGVKYADLALNWIEFIFTAYTSDLLIPFDTVEGLNMSNGNLGSEEMLEAARFSDGHIYGIQAEKWPLMPGITLTGMLFYNPLVIELYSQIDPMEHYENKNWNWETYQAQTNGCTVLSEEIYGTVAKHDDFILNAIFSNDGDVVKYNESTGKYYIALADEDSIEAIEWCQELVSKDQCLLVLDDDSIHAGYFEDGVSAFANCDSNFGFGSPLQNLKTGFRWIPFPTGPSNEDMSNNSRTIMYSTYYAIPMNYDFDEKIFSTVANALFEPIEGQMEWRDYYCEYMIADDTGKSSEVFLDLLDNSRTANIHYFTIADRVTHLAHPLRDIQKVSGGITEMLQKHVPVLQVYIDKAFNE